MLKPQATATRELVNLDGLWQFKVDFKDEGFGQGWAAKPLATDLQAPVPASYNDVFTDVKIREHVGWVWYQRQVRIPRGWAGEKIFVRADSATHEGVIFVNGKEVARHVVVTCHSPLTSQSGCRRRRIQPNHRGKQRANQRDHSTRARGHQER